MKKKLLLAIFLVMTIYISITLGASVNYTLAEEFSNEKLTSEYFENSNKSIEIYDMAIRPYKSTSTTHNGGKVISYSSDYAGVFIDDNGILNIGIVGLQQSTSNFNGQVIYRQYTYSYNYLQDIKNSVTEIMTDYSIYMVGISEKNNNVSIYLTDECDIERVIIFLQERNGFDEKALNFIIDGSGGIVKTNIAYGGESIAKDGFRGTICVNAIDNTTGQLGILTNEHVASAAQNMDMSYRGHWDGSDFSANLFLGNALRGQRTGTIDASFVPYETQANWEMTPYGKYNTTAYTNVRLGNNIPIIEGLDIRKIGQSSGVTDGKVTIADTDAITNYGTDIETIENVIIYSNETLGGDSGGPVYFNDGTNLYLIGMNFAGPADPTAVTYGIGCRIQNVMDILNVTPITNDSFNTTNSGIEIQLDRVNVNPAGAFRVPSAIKGRTVTQIGVCAFMGQNLVTEIFLPRSITSIGDYAFFGCSNLEYIGIPYNVTSIDIGAFHSCNQLTIYAEAASKPSGWNANWNSSNRPVNWNKCSICTAEISQSVTGTGHTLSWTSGHPIVSGSHSFNYINQSGNHIKKCTVCSYEVPEAHSYNHHYGKYNNNQHYAYCICGASALASHNITQTWWNGLSQYGTCGQCNATIILVEHTTHTYNSHDQYSSTYHVSTCACGASTYASHTFNASGTCTKCWYQQEHTCSYTSSYSQIQNNSTHHYAFCSCGKSILASHTFNASGTCTKCWFQTHTHSYTDSYIYYSSTQHLAYCSCGAYNLYSHKFHPIIGNCTNCGYNPLIIMRSASEVET